MRARFPLLALAVFAASVLVNVSPPPAGAAYTINGIDVSHWQGTINWPKVATSGKADFAIIKATEGRPGEAKKWNDDPNFGVNAAGAGGAGVPFGAYHVATPTSSVDDARKEANHFVAVAGPAAGNVIPALDIELGHVPSGMSPSTLETWMRAWLNRVTATTGVRPMVYGSQYLFENRLANTTWFADHGFRLWFAWPRTPLPDTLPANDWQGQGFTFWQFSWTGTVAGISGDVDRDHFVGLDLTSAEIASVTAQPGPGGSIGDGTAKLACAATATCTALYSPGDAIQLTATPDPGYALVAWGGACASAGNAPTCSVTTLGAQTVTATFSYRVRVKVAGDVSGHVTSTPAGIDCPGACAAPFAPGATVTLTASTDPWNGVTWSGDCTGTDPNGCSVVADQGRAVTATFADLGPASATIRQPGARTGSVRVAFDEPVHHVTQDNVLVRPVGGTKLRAALRCFNANAVPTDCRTGRVRSVTLQPRDPLRRGVHYLAVVDPPGAAPIRDGVGNATPLAKRTFSF
jgi:GH25 family lysozyme M1 (1,4-beta-N-acetylmuramidase)